MLNKKVIDRLQWEFYVPIFRNRYTLKGLALAVGLPFGIVIALIIITAKGDIFGTDAKYALGLIVLLFLLTFLLIMIIYGGKYAPGFIVDETGITNYTQARQVKCNRVINGLLIALGAISGKEIIRALQLVYMAEPDREPAKGEISMRVVRAGLHLHADDRTIYRWLGNARTIFAAERGLRV